MTNSQIKQLLRAGDRLDAREVRVYYQAAAGAFPVSACIVSKKIHRQAVVRHRYQRLLRESLRQFLKNHPMYDMVVVAKPEILHIKNLKELQTVLQPYFEKLSKKNKEL